MGIFKTQRSGLVDGKALTDGCYLLSDLPAVILETKTRDAEYAGTDVKDGTISAVILGTTGGLELHKLDNPNHNDLEQGQYALLY